MAVSHAGLFGTLAHFFPIPLSSEKFLFIFKFRRLCYLGISKLFSLQRQSNIKHIIKARLIILFTAETVCILTAETVDLVFYNHSLLLSIPLALLSGTFTVVSQNPTNVLSVRITRKQIVMLPFVQCIFQRVAFRHQIQPFQHLDVFRMLLVRYNPILRQRVVGSTIYR